MNRHRSLFVLLSLACCSASAIAQFELVYPSISAAPLIDIVFLDDRIGYFSNEVGTIYGTSDGGMNWYRRAHYQGDPVTMLRFANPGLGFGSLTHGGHQPQQFSCVYSTDMGIWWSPADVDLYDATDFLPISGSLFLKGTNPGIKRLDNVFGLWATTYSIPSFYPSDFGIPMGTVRQFLKLPGDRVLSLLSYENAKRWQVRLDSLNLLLSSGDHGNSWDTVWCGSQTLMYSMGFASDSIGWLGGYDGTILKTSDGGKKWTLQLADSLHPDLIQQIVAVDSLHVFAVSREGRVFRTSNGGGEWASVLVDGSGIPSSDTRRRIAFLNSAKGFYAGSELFVTTDGGLTWSPVISRIHDQVHRVEFVNRRLGWVLGDTAFYASTDGGKTWSVRKTFLPDSGWAGFDMVDSLTGYAVSRYQWSKTTDGGFTWLAHIFDPPWPLVRGVQFYDKNLGVIFEVWDGAAPYATMNLVTTDGGTTWIKRPITNRSPSSWSKMKFTGPDHLWFSNQQGLWHSRDTAKTWTVQPVDSVYGTDVFDVQDTLRAMCEIFPSWLASTADGGISWNRYPKPYMNQALDMAILGRTYSGVRSSILVGYEGAIFEEEENGMPMYTEPSFTVYPLNSISVYREGNQVDVWVLSSSFEVLHNVYYSPDAIESPNSLPRAFRLFENYPNPFNPRTAVRSQTPEAGEVRIVIYDLLGREVKILVNERRAAGSYEDVFDASGLASGVYIYRMTAGGFMQAKKMLLVK